MIKMESIYYKVIGKGYPIVLLHGNGENFHIYDQFIECMKDDYQLICIDSRYHGQSIKEGEMSYQQMTSDVMNIVDELHITEYDVVGFSDGGIISILLSLQDLRLKHMIIIGVNTKVSGLKTMVRFNDWLMLFCLIPFCLYNKRMRVKWRLVKMMESMKEISQEDLNKIMIPTLILAGEYDLIKQEETDYIHKNIKYSVKKIIKNGTHFLLRDHFEKTYREIRKFLEVCHGEESL